MFDPTTGDILICDNDNVGVNRQSKSQIWGTMEYMAPEIIRGEGDPSTQTDLHSLAVLLFYLWVWHHPFHGEMEYRFYCWDIPAKKKVYGESPVFVFDPEDSSNQLPSDPDYDTARERWNWCPAELKDMFTRAFTVGLMNPDRRVTEGEWQNLFARLQDRIVSCPGCRAENFTCDPAGRVSCWHCGKTIPLPPELRVKVTGGELHVLLSIGTTIRRRHLITSSGSEDGSQVLGKVVPHPSIAGAAGIRNLSKTSWRAAFPDGKTTVVPPGRALPLNPGTTVMIWDITATIAMPGNTTP
jgi:serine/threonine protein kinase